MIRLTPVPPPRESGPSLLSRLPGLDLARDQRSPYLAYAVGFAGIVATLLLRWQLGHFLGERGLYSTLLPTVILAAYLGGVWPGIVATILGALATNFVIVNHLQEIELQNAGDSVAMVLFVATGFVISVLNEALYRAQQRIIQDERRRAALSLEQTERRFSHLVENSSDIISHFAPDGTVLYQTPSITRVLGYLPEERIGKNAFATPIVHPDDLPAEKAFFASMLKSPNSPVVAEFRLQHRDGSWRDIEAIGQNLLDDPAIDGLIVNYRDITDRKLADRAVRDSELRWRSLVQLLPQLIWTTNARGESEYFSPQVGEYTGLAIEQLFNDGWLNTAHDDDRASIVEHWQTAMAAESRYDLEHRIRRYDGVYRWFKVRAVPVRNNDGAITNWLGSCTDITESKELESELRRLNRRLELAVRGSNIAIWEVDIVNRELKFDHGSFINVWEQLGYESLESRQGRSGPHELIHPEDLPVMERALENFLSGASVEFESEYRALHRNGRYRWMLMRGITIWDEANGRWRFTGTSIDVSSLKESEQALRHAKDAAESANRAKDEFLANVSHEIRTPMNAILGMTELVLESSLTDSQQRLLKTVKFAGDNLLNILNDLLDFSKIEAGKLRLDASEFSLRQSIGDVARMLATRAHGQGLEFVCDIADNVPDNVIGDAGRLRQILLNLIGNAIKFTPSGEVVVHVRNNRQNQEPGRVCLMFSVRDTGIGIPVEKQQSIFRAFEQEDMSTTRKYGGTGLGLTITTYLVREMGGDIEVESAPGQGSTFRFDAWFELSDAPSQKLAHSSTAITGRRVLVVDDNETNRIILENWLRHWNLEPDCVDSGVAAMTRLATAAATGAPFDLVVLDRRMPDVDGIEVVRQIRRNQSTSRLPVILLTSGDPEDDEGAAKLVKVQARLTKPCQQADLLDAIQNLFSQPEPAPSEPQPVAAAESPAVSPLRILVAEDNEFNALLMEQLLRKHGHSVTMTPNGRLALQTVQQAEFDLLLLDIHMPELDGFQVAQAVRQHEKTTGKRLPILALTARSTLQIREQCLAAGMDDVVSKPMKAEQLWAAIERVAATDHVDPLPSTDLIDREMLLSVCGGSDEMLAEIVQSFLQNCPGQMERIEQCLAQGDLPELREAAHRLAGTLRAFSQLAGEEALALEEAAEFRRLDECHNRVSMLSQYWQQLQQQVSGLTVDQLQP